jgi:hypothetical protein
VIYIHAYINIEERITHACLLHRRAPVCVSGCKLRVCEPFPSACTACGLGAQAFRSAAAFNANIGAWNTALVSNMQGVCAASGPAARTMADALGRASFDAARPVVRGGTADARARANTCGRWLGGLPRDVRMAARRVDTCTRLFIYIHIHIYMILLLYIYLHICWNRPGSGIRIYVCMLMDRLWTRARAARMCARAACARACGCGRASARTHPRRTVRAPSAGVDRVRPRRAGVRVCVRVQREHRRVEHRVGVEHVRGMRRSRPGGAARCARRRPPMRARAHTCGRSPARATTCVGMAARRRDSIHLNIHICICISIHHE